MSNLKQDEIIWLFPMFAATFDVFEVPDVWSVKTSSSSVNTAFTMTSGPIGD
jgi:hypothetical protein